MLEPSGEHGIPFDGCPRLPICWALISRRGVGKCPILNWCRLTAGVFSSQVES